MFDRRKLETVSRCMRTHIPSFKLAFQFAAQVYRMLQPRVKRGQSSRPELESNRHSPPDIFNAKPPTAELETWHLHIYPQRCLPYRIRVHGPIRLDRYFLIDDKSYLTNLIGNLNQIGNESRICADKINRLKIHVNSQYNTQMLESN